MFQKGDYVVKANEGICCIEEIVQLDMPGVSSEEWYYLMIPIKDQNAKLYTLTDNAENNCRPVMTEQDAWSVIDRIPEIDQAWIGEEKRRETEYKKAILSNDPTQLIGIIKNIYIRKKGRLEAGKKNTAVDERYFKMAENALYQELAFAIGRSKEEIGDIIQDRIGQKE